MDSDDGMEIYQIIAMFVIRSKTERRVQVQVVKKLLKQCHKNDTQTDGWCSIPKYSKGHRAYVYLSKKLFNVGGG